MTITLIGLMQKSSAKFIALHFSRNLCRTGFDDTWRFVPPNSILLEQAGIPYMLTGSFASSVYGMHRGSADVDFIIDADEAGVRRLFDQLPEADFSSELNQALDACRHKSMFNIIDNITGLKIDFIFLKRPGVQSGRVWAPKESNRVGSPAIHCYVGGYCHLKTRVGKTR